MTFVLARFEISLIEGLYLSRTSIRIPMRIGLTSDTHIPGAVQALSPHTVETLRNQAASNIERRRLMSKTKPIGNIDHVVIAVRSIE